METNILYHLSLGLDHVLVLDNGSSDGTDAVLERIAQRDERVSWVRNDSTFDQEKLTTELAREAVRRGADWLVPFDADEFWWVEENNLREILSRTEAGALRVSLVNFVQSRGVRSLKPESLLRMTYRAEEKRLGWGPDTRERIENRELAYVEIAYPQKWISRPAEDVEILRGNHDVRQIRGPKTQAEGIYLLHAPLRSRAVLKNKAEQGRRLDEAGIDPQSGWHLRRLSVLESQGRLDEEWAANSYSAGRLDLGEKKRTLLPDTRLREALSPILQSSTGGTSEKGKTSSARPLFVAGCQRSGTTAFAEYLNVHPEVMLLRERYKFIPHEVASDLLSFERILQYSAGETNVPEEQYVELLASKDQKKLKWVGDKNPDYYAFFGRLVRQNPGARFIVLYRPLEEVAESFEARAKDPEDHWPASFDLQKSVEVWNNALKRTKAFAEGDPGAEVLVLSYRDFFYRNETCIPLISHFLGIAFDNEIQKDWKIRSDAFERNRRQKTDLTQEQKNFLEERKDHAVEEWVLQRIEDQWDNPGICFRGRRGSTSSSRWKAREVGLQRKEDTRREEFLKMRRHVRHLALQNVSLKRQLAEARSSVTWRMLDAFSKARAIVMRQTK